MGRGGCRGGVGGGEEGGRGRGKERFRRGRGGWAGEQERISK